MHNKPTGATVYGIDLGKKTFYAVGTDSCGRSIQRVALGRNTIFRFFANAQAAVIDMEACPGYCGWLVSLKRLAIPPALFLHSSSSPMSSQTRIGLPPVR